MHKVSLFMHIMIKSALIHAHQVWSDCEVLKGDWTYTISTHAPRERSDLGVTPDYLCGIISIHAPRERSDCGINKKYPQPVFILHKYWIFSDIFQRFWQRKTSFYFFFHCKFYVYLAFAQNIISSQGK